MIKEALSYLVSLKSAQIFDVAGNTYSTERLNLIEPPIDRPAVFELNSLRALVAIVKKEIAEHHATPPLFIQIVNPTTVEVYTGYDMTFTRNHPYKVVCRDVAFEPGWRDQQAAIIELKSRFLPTEDTAYLLDLISRVNKDDGVTSQDNGVSQVVTARQGVSMKAFEEVKPRVTLKPFRTFREVEQPESEFILRLDENLRVGLFEADGQVWKMEAKDHIFGFLSSQLAELIEEGLVTVLA